MAQVWQHLLVSLALASLPAAAQKFYPDDPLAAEPAPLNVARVKVIDINAYYDFFRSTFFPPDKEEIKHRNPSPSQAVNTLGEVPDSSWFANRIGSRSMSLDELVRGPGVDHSPDVGKPWTVISAKNEGVTPGLVIRDAAGRRYFLKFDPKSNPEMSSAADVIGSKFCYDLGYFTPQNYIVNFTREQVALDAKSSFKDADGRKRVMTPHDLNVILAKVPEPKNGRYRGMMSLSIPGEIIGPHRYYGTRSDDPNDIVPHENRRDQRGLDIVFAWLNHTDAKGENSLDSIVEDGGVKSVRHFLIDFGDIMGSDSTDAKDPWRGHMFAWDPRPAAAQFLSLGLYAPAWVRADFPHIPQIGNFDYRSFNPLTWRSNYPIIAFELRNPGDIYWAAKKIMAFSDEAVRAIVETGQYSDTRAVEWAVRCLVERRNRIGRAGFEGVLPLDNFAVRGGRLMFEDLAVKAGFATQREYNVAWSVFENQTGGKRVIPGANSMDLPRVEASRADVEYLAADIHSSDPRKTVTVYIHGDAVVGIDRGW